MIGREKSPLFRLPFLTAKNTHYEKLGLQPEATAEEVRQTKGQTLNRLKAEKSTLDKKLENSRATAGRRLAENTEHDPDPLEVDRLASHLYPEFKEMRRKAARLEEELHTINRMPLENTERRLEYDRNHPPFALLTLKDDAPEAFVDPRTALRLVRVELTQFLYEKGVEVTHPSDLTRTDFLADFTHHPRLDGK